MGEGGQTEGLTPFDWSCPRDLGGSRHSCVVFSLHCSAPPFPWERETPRVQGPVSSTGLCLRLLRLRVYPQGPGTGVLGRFMPMVPSSPCLPPGSKDRCFGQAFVCGSFASVFVRGATFPQLSWVERPVASGWRCPLRRGRRSVSRRSPSFSRGRSGLVLGDVVTRSLGPRSRVLGRLRWFPQSHTVAPRPRVRVSYARPLTTGSWSRDPGETGPLSRTTSESWSTQGRILYRGWGGGHPYPCVLHR